MTEAPLADACGEKARTRFVRERLGTSEMARVICEHDWADSPLGPMHEWPETLVRSLETILSSLAEHHDRIRREAAAQERQRIERDLHDSIQRQLVGAQLMVALTRDLVADEPSEVEPLLGALHAQLSTASVELRQIVTGSYPSLLGTRGLVAAVRASAERAHAAVAIEGDVGALDDAVGYELYYAVVEATQNALKHAGPECRIGIRFRAQHERAVVLVYDTGSGFDPATVPAGRGRRNMAERLRSVGGACRIRSRPGAGTVIRFTCPRSGTAGSAAA